MLTNDHPKSLHLGQSTDRPDKQACVGRGPSITEVTAGSIANDDLSKVKALRAAFYISGMRVQLDQSKKCFFDTLFPSLSAISQSQALPRHMRRRTASHKPRRMPVALKNSGKKGRGKNNSRSRKATSGRPFTGKDSEENLDVPSAGIPSADEKNEDGFPNLEGGAGVVGKNVAAGKEGPMRCRKHRRRPRAMLEARSPHAEGILGEERPSRC